MTDSYDENVPDESEQLDQLEPDRTLVDRGVADVLDEGYTAPEGWSAGQRHGNTAAEQAEGETLDQRIQQEVPEEQVGDDLGEQVSDTEVGDERSGRLVDPNEGIGADVDSELVGEEVGIDGGAASAEEAAVHVIEDEEGR